MENPLNLEKIEIVKKLTKLNGLLEYQDKFHLTQGLRIFYIEERYSFLLLNNHVSLAYSRHDHSEIKTLGSDRGKILELFSKIEFLLNECLSLHFFGLNNNNDFDQMLGCIDFSNRIKLLCRYRELGGTLSKKLLNLTYVRNQFAHNWQTHDVQYLQKSILDKGIFIRFRKDMREAYLSLITLHQGLLIDNKFSDFLDEIINKIETSTN